MDRLIRMMAGLASLVALLAAPLAAVAADSPPLAAYGELPAVEDAAISPSGKKIAVVGTFDGRRALVVLDEQLNMTRNSAVGDLKLRGVEWIGDESILLVTSETEDLGRGFTTDQYEAYRALILPDDDSKPLQVVFAGRTTLHFGPAHPAWLLLPVIPPAS